MTENPNFLSAGLAARLEAARLALTPLKGGYVSTAALGLLVGVSDQTIRNYENPDGGTEPDLAMVERLAAAVGLSPGELAFGSRAMDVRQELHPPLPPKEPRAPYPPTAPGKPLRHSK